jgi:hypothetical protein
MAALLSENSGEDNVRPLCGLPHIWRAIALLSIVDKTGARPRIKFGAGFFGIMFVAETTQNRENRPRCTGGAFFPLFAAAFALDLAY